MAIVPATRILSLGRRIRVFNPKEEGTWYDADGVKEKFGVPPDLVVDVLALMGDTIDNIKGVPGIGEKGAIQLITEYGSLENLIGHASEVKHKRYREGLLANIDNARQSRELARIRTDVPVDLEVEALRYRGGSRERSFKIFNELGFRALAKEYAPTADTIAKTYRVVNTPEGVQELASKLRAADGSRYGSSRTARRRCSGRSSGSLFPLRLATGTTSRSGTGRSTIPKACRSSWHSKRCGRSSRTSR